MIEIDITQTVYLVSQGLFIGLTIGTISSLIGITIGKSMALFSK